MNEGILAKEGAGRCSWDLGQRLFPMRFALSFRARMRGLLGTRLGQMDGEVLVLAPCSSIHTFGMGYALDVAFVNRAGTVLMSCRDVPPGRRLRCPGAKVVLEREACGAPWVDEGMRLRLEGSVRGEGEGS